MSSAKSPNFGPRRNGVEPVLIVIHYTAMTSAQAACKTLCNPDLEVSAHYLVAEDGEIAALVAEDQRAWHAGAGRWGGVTDVNSHSVGIEIANPGNCPFAALQMDAVADLVAGIMDRWSIPAHRVIGHSDMAPGRKIDPGARFDWRRLERLGLSVWPDQQNMSHDIAPAGIDMFYDALRTFGYTATDDRALLLDVFRLRFRPRYTGPLDGTDLAMAADLARRFPVDATAVLT